MPAGLYTARMTAISNETSERSFSGKCRFKSFASADGGHSEVKRGMFGVTALVHECLRTLASHFDLDESFFATMSLAEMRA
jgi:hypothetical protein